MHTTAHPEVSAPELDAVSSAALISSQWYTEGETLANAGSYLRALRCFEEAAVLSPEEVDVLIYQAVCLIHLEQPQRALAVADHVLAIAPEHSQGWLYRGVALHRLGRYQESYACYRHI